jgi:hypothetical protein
MEDPDDAVIITPERQMSANELVEAILSMAWRLKQSGVDQESIIGLRTRYLFLALPSILAISLLGCRWIDCSSVLPTEESIQTRLKHSGLKLSHRLEFGDLNYTWDPSTLLVICPQKVVQLNVSLRHGYLPSHKRPAELIGIAQTGAVA